MIQPTHIMQYLHSSSCHPSHQKKSIPYCQVLYISVVFARLTVTTTNTVMNSDYIYNEEPFTNKMKYPNRSYKLLAMQLSLKQAPKPTLNSCLPLTISYHPALPSLQFKMSQRNTTIFSISLRDCSFPRAIIAYHRPTNLHDLLVRADTSPNTYNSTGQ